MNISNSKTWSQVAKQATTTNRWEQKTLERKARRAFAAAHGKHMDAVSLDDVEKSPEGVVGWSQAVVTVGTGGASCGRSLGSGGGNGNGGRNKAKAKAKSPGDGPSSKTLAQYEKDLKSLISKEMAIDEDLQSFKEKLADAAGSGETGWSGCYLAQLEDLAKAVASFRDGNDFFKAFEKAALSPEATRRLRKENGTDYQARVIKCIDGLGEHLTKSAETLTKMQSMGQAAHPDHFKTPKKAKGGGNKRKSPGSV